LRLIFRFDFFTGPISGLTVHAFAVCSKNITNSTVTTVRKAQEIKRII